MSIICDVTSGLLALHQSDIVHGDVKVDNVLIFPDMTQNVSGMRAKLTDFGSIISLSQETFAQLTRYYGTQRTNAPEVGLQSTSRRLDAAGLIRCDCYSLGLLAMEVILGDLSDHLVDKSPSVLGIALQEVGTSNLRDPEKRSISLAIPQFLAHNSEDRCFDLALVHSMLQPANVEDFGLLRCVMPYIHCVID